MIDQGKHNLWELAQSKAWTINPLVKNAFVFFVLKCLAPMLEKSWCHGDLRPPNFCFDEARGTVSLVDYDDALQCEAMPRQKMWYYPGIFGSEALWSYSLVQLLYTVFKMSYPAKDDPELEELVRGWKYQTPKLEAFVKEWVGLPTSGLLLMGMQSIFFLRGGLKGGQ